MNIIKNLIHAHLQKKLFLILSLEGVKLSITDEINDKNNGESYLNINLKRATEVKIRPLTEFSNSFMFELVLAHEIGHCVSFNTNGFISEYSANKWAKDFIKKLPFLIRLFLYRKSYCILN